MRVDLQVKLRSLKATAINQHTRVKKASARAVNDSLFDERAAAPDLLRAVVDRPNAYTMKGVQVEKSSDDKASGIIRIEKSRAEYLGISEHGGEQSNMIVPSRFGLKNMDKFGNLMKRFRKFNWETITKSKIKVKSYSVRTLKNGEKRRGKVKSVRSVGKYFIGTPEHGSKLSGIWERSAQNAKLRPVAFFSNGFKYKKKFGIVDHWQKSLPKRFRENFKNRMSGMRR